MIEPLTEEERQAVIGAIHLAQDSYQMTADNLAHAEHEDDRKAGRDIDRRMDLLESARRKLGDRWEPSPEYRIPDTPEGLV